MLRFYFAAIILLLFSCSGPTKSESGTGTEEDSLLSEDTTLAADTITDTIDSVSLPLDEDFLEQKDEPKEVFEVRVLDFDMLDTSEMNHFDLSQDGNFMHFELGSVAYKRKKDKNWTLILGLPEMKYSAEYIDFDGKGEREILLHGRYSMYGSGGGTSTETITLISIDSVPVIIFDALKSCFEESFGDKLNEGEGRYERSWEREINVDKGSVIIGKLEKSEDSADMDSFCDMPEIEEGTYVWKKGKLRKLEK